MEPMKDLCEQYVVDEWLYQMLMFTAGVCTYKSALSNWIGLTLVQISLWMIQISNKDLLKKDFQTVDWLILVLISF